MVCFQYQEVNIMSYSLDEIEQQLKETDEFIKRLNQDLHNRKIGYSPKCKVCNCEWLDEIEELREDGFTYEQIQQELSLHDISIMSLSRHFKNHYPKSQRYKKEQELEMLQNIREAYINYPFLEEYFKNRPLEYLERFNNEEGFCTDRFGLCNLVKPSTVTNSNDNIINFYHEQQKEIEELKERYYFSFSSEEDITRIKLNCNDKVNLCLNCKNEIQEDRITLLERIITYNFLNITPENKELYYLLLKFDGNKEEFIRKLTEVKEETQAN